VREEALVPGSAPGSFVLVWPGVLFFVMPHGPPQVRPHSQQCGLPDESTCTQFCKARATENNALGPECGLRMPVQSTISIHQ
jgi:hypothetical protein